MRRNQINKKRGIMMFLALLILPFLTLFTFSQVMAAAGDTSPTLADDVSKCSSQPITVNGNKAFATPANCLFLEEPIGGKPNWDLYKVDIKGNTVIWNGGSLAEKEHGPIQAILTMEPSKQNYGPFSLLYNYIRLVYNYMSGVIIGVSVLFVVIGGIQITLYGAKEENLNQGKARIVKAIVGLIIWFTASLILYTINPTFFTFYQGP